ncbi:TPA: hypothetical protein L9968_002084 [Klebsiella aerogenes]|nr:hypothetical protein [Klebsiella aerogenes]HDU5190418.1 hypothetical protein [Klebsiella aerogenes]
MTNNQLTEAELTETLDAATSGYPLTASAEANLRRVFAELQERRKPLQDKDLQGVIGALEHPAGINATGKQVVRSALVELQELRRSYLALRGEIEDVQSHLYEAEKQANEYAEELQERRKTSGVPAAVTDVLAERQRQVTAEGWTPEGDDDYTDGELPRAASCYALMAWREECLSDGEYTASQKAIPHHWPWDPAWWKPTDPRRDLVKAGALILAEIERIDRARSNGHE